MNVRHYANVSPDLYIAIDRGNVVLVTPERVTTVTDVDRLCQLLQDARTLRDAEESDARSR